MEEGLVSRDQTSVMVFAVLFSLGISVAGLAADGVRMEKTEDGIKAVTDVYTAVVDKMGSIQSLVVGGTEFIAPKTVYQWQGKTIEWPGTACGRWQGGGWPPKLVPLKAVTRQEDNLVRAEGDQWAVEYRFLPDEIEFTVSGVIEGVPFDGWPKVSFFWSLSPQLARACDPESQGELGWPLARPYEGGKLAVLDLSGAGVIGLPACGLSTRENYTLTWPLLMSFPAEQQAATPLNHKLKLFKKADLAHSIKVEIVSPNPDHFFVGTTEATIPVKVEILYGHALNGRLLFTGTPFVWGKPEVTVDLPLQMTANSATKTVPLRVATPKPGQYTGAIRVMEGDKKLVSKRVGFLMAPEQIPPAPIPPDFDAFWDQTMAELEKIPFDLEMKPMPAMGTKDGQVFKVKYRSWGGRWAWAWLHVPNAEAKVPGSVTCPPVGTYHPGPQNYCGELSIKAAVHGADIEDKEKKVDFDYMNTGISNRETYLLRYSYCCLARCYDIVKNHPKCNGTISAGGGSQGGGLSLVLAGLRPVETVMGWNIALCRIDWTILGLTKWGPSLPKGEDAARIAAIVSYYDPARFTHRTRSKTVRIGFGLFDWCAPAEGIMSAINGLPKDVVCAVYADPFGDHFNSDLNRFWAGGTPIEIPRWQGTDADNKVSK